MRVFRFILAPALFVAGIAASFPVAGQTSVAEITQGIRGLRAVPDAQRGARTTEIALQIRALPNGPDKLKLAYGLSHLATEGDFGKPALQAVTTTLGDALTANPVPSEKGEPAGQYLELAKLVRYESMTTTFKGPELTKAQAVLASREADIQKADFTLTDLKGKKYTLSALRGKIVVVNFWATWCPPCRKEMPDLDAIYNQYKSEGLVILSISDETMEKVAPFIQKTAYTPPVLLDPGRKVNEAFHVEGIPQSFVFDRKGKLVTLSIDMRTKRQFLEMLAKAGLRS